MKTNKVIAPLVALLALATGVNAAVTLTSRNFSSATAGVPIVNAAGASLDQGTFIWTAGTFATLPNFATSTAAEIIGLFTSVVATPGGVSASLDGMFNASQTVDFGTNTAPNAAYVGHRAYVLVGNGTTLANSTLIAVFDSGTNFSAANALGSGSQTLTTDTTDKVLYGKIVNVTTQPSTTFNVPKGVQLVSVPETSTALLGALGALGLLRRRR